MRSSPFQCLMALAVALLAALCVPSASAKSPDPNPLWCGLRHCPGSLISCARDDSCGAILACNKACSEREDPAGEQACHLLCQLEGGGDSQGYRDVVQCFADNTCLPQSPLDLDGICPVDASNLQATLPVQSFEELRGTWREVRGRNCGRPDSRQDAQWQGGYDALECRSSSWVERDERFWYHTSFSGEPTKERLPYLIAEPEISTEDSTALAVHYLNPPLTPQNEAWYVLSRPTEDWIAYTYCGETPAGRYAGVNIITRSETLSGDAIPADVVEKLRSDLATFGLDYDEFCPIDHTECRPPQAATDLEEGLSGVLDTSPQ